MLKFKNTHVFYFVVVSFVLLNAYVLSFHRSQFYAFNLIPFAIIIILLAIFDIEKIMLAMVFFTPLAISLKELKLSQGLDLSIPSEPLMIIMTLLYFLNELSHGITDRKLLKHPITILIFVQLGWMIITMITSELPIISVKYILARTWFITSCYFMAMQLFKNKNNINLHILLYATAMAIVCIVTTVKHAGYAFDEKIADWIVSPFYNDHTAYGAALAMFIPLMVGLILMKTTSNVLKIYAFILLSIFLVSIVVSFARAGWLSLAVSLAVLVTLLLKIKLRTILITIVTSVIIFISFQAEVLMILGRNNTDSDGDLMENVQSMSNITTDVSNLERLNRWSCAFRMFQDKPVLGFGPGTYQFLYAPYQKSSQMTIISTNFGEKGNAHSEYLGPLCEQGLVGLLIVLALVLASMFLGYRLVYTVKDKSIKILVICLVMGISTYFVHGFLNNFLDTDKASVPFWGFLAMLVAIDLYYKDNQYERTNNLV